MSEQTTEAGGRRRRTFVVTPIVAAYALGYTIWERGGWGSTQLRDLIGNLGFMPLNLTVMALLGLAARNPILDPAVRRALRLLAVSLVVVFLGNAVSSYYVLFLGSSPAVSWADALYLLNYLLTLLALAAFPIARRTRREGWKFVLDALMVLVGGGVVIWYFTIRPAATQGTGLVVMVQGFLYPLFGLLILLAIAAVLLRQPLDANRRAFSLLLGGLALSIVADLLFGLILVESGERIASWIDELYLVFYLMLTASGELYLRRPEPRGAIPADFRVQPLSLLPYIAVIGCYLVLLVEAMKPWTEPVSTLATAAVLVTVIVVIRQVLAVSENVRLLGEASARKNEARFRSLVQHSSDVILVVDPDATIRFASPSVARVFGYDPTALSGLALPSLLDPEDRERARSYIREAGTTEGISVPTGWRFRQPDGSFLHAETIATNLMQEPTVGGIVLNTRDVSERRRLEQQLVHQAFHDPLTGLANRSLFRDRVSHALSLARRAKRTITVLFLDLDDFKKVNDSLGHGEGDRLLVQVAERFRTCARASDTVARLGGDEFAVLVEDALPDAHMVLVERLTEVMAKPFTLGGNELDVRTSIGIATAAPEETADDVLRNADMAMYTAKRRGKGRAATYEAHMHSVVRQRLEMEAALRTALERGELLLHYQPVFSLRRGTLVAVEALVRWDHPIFGMLLPQHFIPLAEETGQIVKLGGWVLRAACHQLRAWKDENPRGTLVLAVNVSGRQLHELGMVEEIQAALAETGVDPASLVLEITETVLMQQTEAVLGRLQEVKALGVRLAIDDFGTGYSSLSYLQRFPVDILKIAKPFTEDVGAGVDRSAIARAIIGLGNTLHLRTIAEGIERAEQRSALAELGCEMGQGYYFSAPVPPEDIAAFLRTSPIPALTQSAAQ